MLGGEIPTSIGNLLELRVLVMKENNFTESIRREIGQLMNLEVLLLSSNHISGLIQYTIVSLQAIELKMVLYFPLIQLDHFIKMDWM